MMQLDLNASVNSQICSLFMNIECGNESLKDVIAVSRKAVELGLRLSGLEACTSIKALLDLNA